MPTSGPIFDGQARAVIDRIRAQAREEIAKEAANDVRAVIGHDARRRTGHYEGQVVTDLARRDVAIVKDLTRYGPWLEGVSKRNRDTRFRGYQQYARVTQDLRRGKAAEIAERVLREHLGALG